MHRSQSNKMTVVLPAKSSMSTTLSTLFLINPVCRGFTRKDFPGRSQPYEESRLLWAP